jgi:hypothetical protein
MKNISKITLALAAVSAAVIVLYAVRRAETKRMLAKVADEGYETAHDILFPDKMNTQNQMHFGPVLPD